MVVDEAQRRIGRVGLQPQRHARQLQRHRVHVHAVQAVGDHVAQRVAVVVGCGLAAVAQQRVAHLRTHPGQVAGNAPRRGQQEMAAAAGRVDHADGQQRLHRAFTAGLGGQDGGNHRLQRGIKLLLHQRVGGVVAAGGFAGVAAGGRAGLEAELAVALAELGHQLQQAFVDAAQLFRAHVAPVDAAEWAVGVGTQPGQLEQRQHQVAVFQPAGVERGALVGVEQAAQRWQGQQRLTHRQALPDLLECLPEVTVPVMRAAAHGALTQAAQAVALGVQGHGGGVGAAAVQDFALFHRQQEYLAVDQAQQFTQVVLRAELAAGQRLTQGGVGRVADKALAQHQQRLLNPYTQGFAGACALLTAGAAPLL